MLNPTINLPLKSYSIFLADLIISYLLYLLMGIILTVSYTQGVLVKPVIVSNDFTHQI